MGTKKIGFLVIAGLLIATLIPAYNLIRDDNEDNLNKNIVFEYSNKKVYESQMKPYIDYYLKMNGNDDLTTKNMAVDNYIRSVLMADFAIENGFQVLDIEIEEFIKKVPVLMIEDEFSMNKYEEFLSVIGIKKHTFEEEIRKDLIIKKMMESIDEVSNINDFYFNIMKDVLSQKRTIEKVKLNLDNILVEYKEEDIKRFYDLNKDNYREQENIEFYKKTYIHPLNQSLEDEDIEIVRLETTELYEFTKNMSKEDDLVSDFKSSIMTLKKDSFYDLIGLKENQGIANKMVFIDNTNVENGVITLYQVNEIISGDIKSFENVRGEIINDYNIEDKIEIAFEEINKQQDFKDILKSKDNDYFVSYKEEVINPLENNESKYLYELAYSMPLNDIKFYYDGDTNEFFFIKLKSIEEIELSEEQVDYFRTSQNNMYKQFVMLSLYDGIKRKYDLVKHKKER